MNFPKLSIIVAHGDNLEIGTPNGLLWHLKSDLKRFRELTTGHPIIMGAKTFGTIGRVLPNRLNIVVSLDDMVLPGGAVLFHNLEQAIEYAKSVDPSEVFVIGGGEIYRQTLPMVDRLYVTHVNGSFPDATVWFPDYSDWAKHAEVIESAEGADDGLRWEYRVLEHR